MCKTPSSSIISKSAIPLIKDISFAIFFCLLKLSSNSLSWSTNHFTKSSFQVLVCKPTWLKHCSFQLETFKPWLFNCGNTSFIQLSCKYCLYLPNRFAGFNFSPKTLLNILSASVPTSFGFIYLPGNFSSNSSDFFQASFSGNKKLYRVVTPAETVFLSTPVFSSKSLRALANFDLVSSREFKE